MEQFIFPMIRMKIVVMLENKQPFVRTSKVKRKDSVSFIFAGSIKALSIVPIPLH